LCNSSPEEQQETHVQQSENSGHGRMEQHLQRHTLIAVAETGQQRNAKQNAVIEKVEEHARQNTVAPGRQQTEHDAQDERRDDLENVHVIQREKETAEDDRAPQRQAPAQASQNEAAESKFLDHGRQETEDQQRLPPGGRLLSSKRAQFLDQGLSLAQKFRDHGELPQDGQCEFRQ